jgi:hypothetical protein
MDQRRAAIIKELTADMDRMRYPRGLPALDKDESPEADTIRRGIRAAASVQVGERDVDFWHRERELRDEEDRAGVEQLKSSMTRRIMESFHATQAEDVPDRMTPQMRALMAASVNRWPDDETIAQMERDLAERGGPFTPIMPAPDVLFCGATMRDYYAGKALGALAPEFTDMPVDTALRQARIQAIADTCYQLADAMVAAGKKEWKTVKQPQLDISGVDRAALLAALFNNTAAIGNGQLHPRAKATMTQQDALQLLKDWPGNAGPSGDIWFDYLWGRPIKVGFIGERLMRPDLYDRDAPGGAGTCERLVEELRKKAAP